MNKIIGTTHGFLVRYFGIQLVKLINTGNNEISIKKVHLFSPSYFIPFSPKFPSMIKPNIHD